MADPRSEPSMEDILASIKRIIADDQSLPMDRQAALPAPAERPALPKAPAWPEPKESGWPEPKAPTWAERAPPSLDRPPAWPTRTETQQPPESILELTNLAPQDMQPPRVPPASRVAPPEPPVAPPPPPAPELPVQRAADRQRQPDISWRAPEEAAPPPPAPEPAPRPAARDLGQTIVNRATGGDNTLEGLVRDMLRPMLSDWIDTHAPAMVQRIVQEEIRKMIEREARGE